MVVNGGSSWERLTKYNACHEICTPRSTKYNACQEICASRSTQNSAPALQGPQSTAPATISENKPHVQKSRFTAPVTTSEHVTDVHQVQSARACHEIYTSKQNRSDPLRVSRKVDFGHQNTRLPLRLPPNVSTVPKNAHGPTTKAQSRQAPAASAVDMHFEGSEAWIALYPEHPMLITINRTPRLLN